MELSALWIGFAVLILGLLCFDLGVFHKKAHTVSFKESVIWSVLWTVLALAFNAAVYVFLGEKSGTEFLTGYLIERSLSLDNVFVFLIIFSYFSIPSQYHHKVLFWGIVGALAMRAIMIGAGVYLIDHFHWILYVFGAFLLFTAVKMLLVDQDPEPKKNPLIRWLWTHVPMSSELREDKFFVRDAHHAKAIFGWIATPLFLVLLTVEISDLIFAVDSIPAIFGITEDPFIIYTSNIFAILGMRAMYFLLAAVMDKFYYLKHGLSFVLFFIGSKMLLTDFIHIPVGLSLGLVAAILSISIIFSLVSKPGKETHRTFF